MTEPNTRDGAPEPAPEAHQPPRDPSVAGLPIDRRHDLEPAVVTLRDERSLLLRHIIATEDELDEIGQNLTRLRAEHAATVDQLVQKTQETGGLRGRLDASTRSGRLRTLLWLSAVVAAAALSVAAFVVVVGTPRMRQAATEAAALRQERDVQVQNAERLRSELGLKEEALKAASGGNSRAAEELAAERKELAARVAAVQKESDAVEQRRVSVENDRRALADARRQLEDERGAFEKARTAPVAAGRTGGAPPATVPPAVPSAVALPSGVMMWRGDFSGTTAAGGTTIVITPHQASFGTLTNGAFPERPSELRTIVINGTATVRRPASEKEWGRLYLNVTGKGTVTVFLIWGSPQLPAKDQ